MKYIKLLILSAILLLPLLYGCSKKGGSSSNEPVTSQPDTSKKDPPQQKKPTPNPLPKPAYDKLSPLQKYQVSNKLLSTLYKGMPADEFFIISDSFNTSQLKNKENMLDIIEKQLDTPLDPNEKYLIVQRVNEKYVFDNVGYPQKILALLYEFPLSKDYFDMWMAYFLANTIMFSPALELDSVEYSDTYRVFQRLYSMISEDKTVKEIAYEHMISQENWRRFRSPEDNTREMMEIFLHRFIDEEVPKAAKACQNWYLTEDFQGYSLVIDFNENTEPQNILDTWVTTCYDFYKAIVEHKDFMPTVVKTIVNYLFPTYPEDKKNEIVNAVLSTEPKTFREIFKILLFSEEYLIRNTRPKYYEELFMGTAYRIKWKPSSVFFKDIFFIYWKPPGWSSLQDMKQAPLTYKLGRNPIPPLDYLSFAFYHKAIRETLLIKRSIDAFSPYDYGWKAEFVDNLLEGNDFINFIFVSVLGREATQKELETLNSIFATLGYDNSFKYKDEKALITLDYISRLPELYIFKSIN